MFRDLQPCASSTETGLPWVPTIPSHWSLVRNKYLLRVRKETVGSQSASLQLLSLTKSGVITRDIDNLEGKTPATFDTYQHVSTDDLIFCHFDIDETPRTVGLVHVPGMITGAYTRFEVRAGVSAAFLANYYIALDDRKALRQLYSGLRKSIKTDVFLAVDTPLPPVAEQAAIVKYLGHAHARIDRAIAAKRKLIALLEEQKQAIIDQAVTRGLAPTASMKDSGVPWIGEVPAHWGVAPVGALTSLVQTGPFGSQLHADEYVDGGIPVVNPSHLSPSGILPDPAISISRAKAQELARHRFMKGDIVVARRGELGRCAVVETHEVGWVCGTGSLIARPRREALLPGYFQRCLSSKASRAQLGAGSIGATMANLNAQMIARLRVAVPPLAEQARILQVVEEEELGALRRRAVIQREVDVLREFRTRLTSDVVTGQLDVREIASTLPDFVEPGPLDADSDEGASSDELDEMFEEVDA